MPEMRTLATGPVVRTGVEMQIVNDIFKLLGKTEGERREGIYQDRLNEAMRTGATPQEMADVLGQPIPFEGGVLGLAQKGAGIFAPPSRTKAAMTGQMLESTFRKPLSPTQQIASRKVSRMDKLQTKVDAGMATENEKAMLEKMLAGQPMVQIGLGQPAAPGERKDIAETRASIDALDNLRALFDNPRTETGPLKGRIAPFAGLIGMTSDEQESFMAATSAFKNRIIKEITGAQMSEVEAKRIMKQIPDITDPAARWKAKWEQSKKNLEMLQNRRMEILGQSGIRVPIGDQEVTVSGEQTQTPITATNPKTGKKIQSFDGGKTWQPIQ